MTVDEIRRDIERFRATGEVSITFELMVGFLDLADACKNLKPHPPGCSQISDVLQCIESIERCR